MIGSIPSPHDLVIRNAPVAVLLCIIVSKVCSMSNHINNIKRLIIGNEGEFFIQ